MEKKIITKQIEEQSIPTKPKYEYQKIELVDFNIHLFNEMGKNGWKLITVDYRRSAEEMREIKMYLFMREL